MNVKSRTLGVSTLLLLSAAGVLFWLHRSGGEETSAGEDAGAVSRVAEPKRMRGEKPPAMRPPQVSEDADPVGSLRLEGQVIDENEDPIGGARVTLSSNPKRTTTSGEDGSFAFDKLIGKSYQVSAKKGELVGAPVQRALTETSDPVIIHMSRGATLKVTVVAADGGRPISGSRVSVQDDDETTGEDGLATFRGIAGGYAAVRAQAPGYGAGHQLVQIPPSPGAPVTTRIALRRGAPVSGLVVDADGAPVAGAKVRAIDAADFFSLPSDEDGATTGDDGRFRLAAVAAGTYRFTARHDDYPPASSESMTVDGEHPTGDVRIVLPPGATLAGRVVDGSGDGVAWATIRVQTKKRSMQGWSPGVRQATAEEDGSFAIRGLPRKQVVAAARDGGAASELAHVDLAARHEVADLVLKLDVEGEISGVVVDDRGDPVPEAQVSAMPDFFGGGDVESFTLRGPPAQSTDGGGRFRFQGLPDGKYILHASRGAADMQRQWQEKGTAAATGDGGVELVLAAPGSIKGRVLLDDGAPPKMFTVTLGYPPGLPVAGGDGRFALSKVKPGTYDVSFRGPGFAETIRRDVVVRAGQSTDLGTVSVERGRSVSGRVLDESGAPVAGATVVAARQLLSDGKSLTSSLAETMAGSFGMRETQTDDSGAYRLEGIGEKKLVLAAEDPERGRSLPVRIPPGSESPSVDLVLQPFGSLRGKVLYGGEPGAGAQITATSKTNPDQNIMVKAGDDGLFTIERLAAGEYAVTAMVGAGIGTGDVGSAQATVIAGEEASVAIEVDAGSITVSVAVEGEASAEIPAAQTFMFDGVVQAKKADDLKQAFLGGASGVKMSFAMAGKPAKFERVKAGTKSVCVIPLPGDLSDPRNLRRMQENADKLEVHCSVKKVAGSPLSQSLTVQVPPPAPLPDPGDESSPG